MKIFHIIGIIAVGLILVAAAGENRTAFAQTGQLIGSRIVSDNADIDTIQAQGGQAFSAVRLCVAQRAVNFHDFDIFFANGGHQDATIRNVIAAGQCTRWINLSGQRRNIAYIVMRYDTRRNAGPQAIVSAYGR